MYVLKVGDCYVFTTHDGQLGLTDRQSDATRFADVFKGVRSVKLRTRTTRTPRPGVSPDDRDTDRDW